jgi:glycerophosphoryl diester phosphodiesterase
VPGITREVFFSYHVPVSTTGDCAVDVDSWAPRGPAIAPENTQKAIRAGMVCADYIEVDVRLSRDGVPVIVHDARLDCTTSGSGQVNDLTLKELKELDAGDRENVPTLEEAFNIVVKRDRGMLIEITEPGSEEIICSVIRNFYLGKSIVILFHSEILSIMKACVPGLKAGIIVPNSHGHPHIEENWFQFDWILPGMDVLTSELVTRAHHIGKRVLPRILNTKGEFKKAYIMGVDGLITDDPCNAVRTMKTSGYQISL